MASSNTSKFHSIRDLASFTGAESFTTHPLAGTITVDRTVRLRFGLHLHPYVRELIQRLIEGSVRGLEGADTENPPADGAFFPLSYDPNPAVVGGPYPVKDLDFRSDGAYSVYNWELFFHIPLTVALHLSKNQRFEEAQRWLHYIFDPTTGSPEAPPMRFWNVAPFKTTSVESIQKLLKDLAAGDPSLIESIQRWKKSPFRPHLVARYRISAYMWRAVMAYLDNLIAWGDYLFAQDTGESINEATQLYILAANLLGPRPQPVPAGGRAKPKTYNDLRPSLDAFSNALVDLETDVPFDAAPLPDEVSDPAPLLALGSLGKTLYFCVPRNDKVLGYWDTVADRLFKIRNSLNLQGIFRQLPLFEPPIDPALLARAVAAGVDVGAALSGAKQPLPLVRFQLLLQKALEICGEVKSLGQSLLSAIEKQDGEALALLRARQESVVLKLGEAVRYGQWQEAIRAREGLEKSLATAAQRYAYYERQLGKQENEIQIPELAPLDTDGLLREKLRTGEPVVATRAISIQLGSSFRDGGHKLNPAEANELNLMEGAQIAQDIASGLDATGAFLSLIPDISGHVTPIGVGAAIRFGGTNLGHLFRGLATVARGVAGRVAHEAQISGKLAGYDRREQEWALQSNLAACEITAIYKQIRAAQIREAVARREWENHQQQIKNAEEMERFLTDEKKGKLTNQAFYALLRREVKGLYGQAFQLAFEVAKKAERALGHELGDASRAYLQAGYLAGKEGLLAGEKLYLDLKRMEGAYLDQNRREYELTKHVSLLELDPLAVMALRRTGRCTVHLPEELFDLDGPGHYFRRIKSVAVSLPCVAGPYTSVNVTLSLQKSAIRTSPLLAAGKYEEIDETDARFDRHFGAAEAIVTSSAQNDAGLFENNLKDERYLPFEYAGAISDWEIRLPAEVRQFDFSTITDLVLHLRYTAREGGELLRKGAVANLQKQIGDAKAAGSVRLLSARRELPAAFAKLKSSPAGPRIEWTVKLLEEHYPIWSNEPPKGKQRKITGVTLIAETQAAFTVAEDGAGTGAITLDKDQATGLFKKDLTVGLLPKSPTGAYTLFLEDKARGASDIWLAVTWGWA